MQKSATISKCYRYRYRLIRVWDDIYPYLICILHNPSTADANTDDATIRRLIGFARRFGHGGIVVYNLCAYRATDPKQLGIVPDPFGPDNDRHLSSLSDRTVLCAWGNTTWTVQEKRVIKMLRDRGCLLMCLGMTKQGHPKHPVRLPYDAVPMMQIMELGLGEL
jgi:hypothetical protein